MNIAELKLGLRRRVAQPPKVYHSYLCNVLGLQPARCLLQEAARRVRRTEPVNEDLLEAVARLESDGLLLLPNFLENAIFDAIKVECDRALSQSHGATARREGDVLLEERRLSRTMPNFESFQTTFEQLAENSRLLAIVGAAARRRIRVPPVCIIQRATVPETFPDCCSAAWDGSDDLQNCWHQDHFVPVFKAWLYLDHIDSSNGAFEYGYGSHRATRARLAYEYERSLHECHSMAGRLDRIPPDCLDRGRVVPSVATWTRMGACRVSIAAGPNTLVIANTRGFHRRGVIQPGRARRLVYIDFRRLESFINRAAFIRRFVDVT